VLCSRGLLCLLLCVLGLLVLTVVCSFVICVFVFAFHMFDEISISMSFFNLEYIFVTGRWYIDFLFYMGCVVASPGLL
jgi:hypothetical protein